MDDRKGDELREYFRELQHRSTSHPELNAVWATCILSGISRALNEDELAPVLTLAADHRKHDFHTDGKVENVQQTLDYYRSELIGEFYSRHNLLGIGDYSQYRTQINLLISLGKAYARDMIQAHESGDHTLVTLLSLAPFIFFGGSEDYVNLSDNPEYKSTLQSHNPIEVLMDFICPRLPKKFELNNFIIETKKKARQIRPGKSGPQEGIVDPGGKVDPKITQMVDRGIKQIWDTIKLIPVPENVDPPHFVELNDLLKFREGKMKVDSERESILSFANPLQTRLYNQAYTLLDDTNKLQFKIINSCTVCRSSV